MFRRIALFFLVVAMSQNVFSATKSGFTYKILREAKREQSDKLFLSSACLLIGSAVLHKQARDIQAKKASGQWVSHNKDSQEHLYSSGAGLLRITAGVLFAIGLAWRF